VETGYKAGNKFYSGYTLKIIDVIVFDIVLLSSTYVEFFKKNKECCNLDMMFA
jgi:hypothetical protein